MGPATRIEDQEKTRPQRLLSLDVFRGATLALMVVVNNPGLGSASYAPLRHAEWHGWTLTDTVFPSFLWIVGVAITLSLAKRQGERGALLGMSIYAYPQFDLGTQRILGVLQRIAICYVAASLIFLYSGARGQVLWIAGLFAAYWAAMAWIPVPGFGAGRLDLEGNFAHYVDRLVLGRHNYAGNSWDPEGIVSTLPALATTLFGVLAGRILRRGETRAERTTRLFLAGNLLLVAGAICDHWLPINKKLWTDSFAVWMAGLDFVAMAMLVWAIDGRGWKRLTRPFAIIGMNAITVYLASEFGDELLQGLHWKPAIYRAVFAPWFSPANASLAYALAYTAVMFGIAYAMYRRRWFLRV